MLFFVFINGMAIVVISFLTWKKSDAILKQFFWPAWAFKLSAGIGLGLFYLFQYDETGDTYTYFYDAVTLAEAARNNPGEYLRFMWAGDETFALWGNLSNIQTRAMYMVKLCSLVNLLSHDNYWVTSLYFSLISFLASWRLTSEIIKDNRDIRFYVIASFLFLPSFVFWSSGLIKESFATACLFVLCTFVLKVWRGQRFSYWDFLLLPFALWTLWSLKYYYLAVFLPVTAASLGTHLFIKTSRKSPSIPLKVGIWVILLVIPLIAITLFHPNFYPEVFLEVITSNYEAFLALSAPEDVIHFYDLQPTVGSMLLNAPWALVSGLFRPFLWEASNFYQLISAAENTLLLVLTVFALSRLKVLLQSPWRLHLLTVFLYCIGLCVFLTLSTPNFGTLSRYRGGFLPFYFLLITIDNPAIRWLARIVQRN